MMMYMHAAIVLVFWLCHANSGGPIQGESPPPWCDVPLYPDNGYLEMPNRGINGTVTYQCFDGFWYTGTKTRICQPNRLWSGHAGICEVVQCPVLPDVLHGRIHYSGREFKDEAKVKCEEGYIYNYPQYNPRVCQGNNTWSFVHGLCEEVQCPELDKPSNGTIRYTGRGYTDTATLECDLGFKYNKPASVTRTCQGDNRWSLEFDGECQQIRCTSTPGIENGEMGEIANNQYGVNVTFLCNFGYVTNDEGLITCQVNGKWSDGRCEMKPQMKLLYLLSLLCIPLLIGVLYLFIRKYKQACGKSQADMDDEQSIPLTKQHKPENIYHCSITVKDDFGAGSFDSDKNPLFVSNITKQVQALLQTRKTKVPVDVSVTCKSAQRRMVFLDIKYPQKITQDEIVQAFHQSNRGHDGTFHFCPDTIHFRDCVTARLATEIANSSHVTDSNLDKPIDLDYQYVRLKILLQKKASPIQRDNLELPDKYQADLSDNSGIDITDEDIITPDETQKVVVIRGRAGIGKSTLVRRLMRRWAHTEWATQFKVVFLLNLRALVAITAKLDLPHVLSQCGVYNIGYNGIRLQTSWLKMNEQSIGFILDGLDEISNFQKLWENCEKDIKSMSSEAKPVDWGFSLMKRTCLPESTIIITSRPFAALSYLRPSKVIEVMGLTRDRVLEFVDKNVRPNRIAMVKQTLLNNPILLSVSAITFFCAALCSVLQEDIGLTEKLTTYTQITAFIMERFMRRSSKTLKVSDALDKVSNSLRKMCRVAYDGLLKRTDGGLAQLQFDEEDLEKHNLQPEDLTNARDAGIFVQTRVPSPEESGKEKVIGQFVHLFIQEFLAMVGLLMESPRDIKRRVKMLIKSGQFKMALLFLYGVLFNQSNEAITKLCFSLGGTFEVKDDIRSLLVDKIKGLSDDLLILQMIHETQSQEIARDVGQQRFPDEIQISNTKLTIVDVLAMIFLLKHHTNATKIGLKDVGLDNCSIKALSTFLKGNKSICSLKLFDNGIDDEGVGNLAEALMENEKLEELVIESINVKDMAVKALASSLEQNLTLSILSIESNHVSDQGVSYLADALQTNSKLTYLKILSNKVKDIGVGLLATSLKENCTLKALSLFSNSVTEKGVEAIASMMKTNKTLERIDLEWTSVDDKGAHAILLALEVNETVHIRIAFPSCGKERKHKLQSHERITVLPI